MPPAAENPEGFYEHLEFVRLNDEVLNVAGAGWDCPPAADFDWNDEALDPFRERARQLGGAAAGAAPLGLERPAHEPDAAVLARCVRSFADGRRRSKPARSRYLAPPPQRVFDRAWIDALADLCRAHPSGQTSPDERLVTHFDSYFLEPDREIARVLHFLDLTSRARTCRD